MMKSIIILLALALVTGVQSSGGCGDNYDEDAAKESDKCSGSAETCLPAGCCKVKLTCKALANTGTSVCGDDKTNSYDAYVANDAATTTTFVDKCCKDAGDAKTCGELAFAIIPTILLACGDDLEYDQNKMGTAAVASDADLKTKCCKAKAVKPNCGNFECAAGYNNITGKAETECPAEGCDISVCCELDENSWGEGGNKPQICLAVEPKPPCDTGFYFPESKHGASVAHCLYCFKATCCVPGTQPITCNSLADDSSDPKNCTSTDYNILDDSTTTAETFNADCCKPKATCANAWATSGTLRSMPAFVVVAVTGIVAALL